MPNVLPENPIHNRDGRNDNPLFSDRGAAMPTPAELKAEIANDPVAMGYAASGASGDDTATAAIINDPTRRSAVFPMRVGDFANWLAGAGLLRAIRDAQTHADPVVSSLSILLMLKIQGDPSKTVDPTDASTQGMFGAFVAASIAAEAHVAAFTVACTRECSRCEELGWSIVSVNQIGEARAA